MPKGKNKKYSKKQMKIARSGKIVSELYDLGFISKGINAHRKIEMTTEQMGSVANLNVNKSYPIQESLA